MERGREGGLSRWTQKDPKVLKRGRQEDGSGSRGCEDYMRMGQEARASPRSSKGKEAHSPQSIQEDTAPPAP